MSARSPYLARLRILPVVESTTPTSYSSPGRISRKWEPSQVTVEGAAAGLSPAGSSAAVSVFALGRFCPGCTLLLEKHARPSRSFTQRSCKSSFLHLFAPRTLGIQLQIGFYQGVPVGSKSETKFCLGTIGQRAHEVCFTFIRATM